MRLPHSKHNSLRKKDPLEPAEDQWKHDVANKIQKLAIILFNRPVFNSKTALKECSKKYEIFHLNKEIEEEANAEEIQEATDKEKSVNQNTLMELIHKATDKSFCSSKRIKSNEEKTS